MTLIENAFYVRVEHYESGYGIFLFNKEGDFCLMTDYGEYTYIWRAFADDFPNWIKSVNVDYILNKLYINWINNTPKDAKARWKFKEKHLKNIVELFLKTLNTN